MRFKVANYSRLEIRLDTLHIYNRLVGLQSFESQQNLCYTDFFEVPLKRTGVEKP